ncbi:MAG: hypothetical protein HY975_00500, partial [Candidatus Kerfeldbacteria bacterium]|nr:hypothetical protein [Candidatus Kerfeldbacteria bacterium]
MPNRVGSEVTEQTRTLSAVGQMTNVVLGVAIGLGFVAAGLAYFFVMPIDGDGGGAPTYGTPLKVAAVTDAKSMVQWNDQFHQMKFYAGSTLAYTATSVVEGIAGSTTTNQPLKLVANATVNNNTNSAAFFNT